MRTTNLCRINPSFIKSILNEPAFPFETISKRKLGFPELINEKIFIKIFQILVFPAAFDYGPNVFGAQWFVKEVFPKIKSKVHDAELYLVGKSPKEEVKKLAAHDIKVTGTVPDMLPYMKGADLFIVPIFFGGGVKTKLIEMGCWKKPIVTTEEGRVGTIYTDGDVCIANSPADFAVGCINALQHPETYAPRCEGMYKKTVDNYLWDNIGEKYINFLNEIILQNEEK